MVGGCLIGGKGWALLREDEPASAGEIRRTAPLAGFTDGGRGDKFNGDSPGSSIAARGVVKVASEVLSSSELFMAAPASITKTSGLDCSARAFPVFSNSFRQ